MLTTFGRSARRHVEPYSTSSCCILITGFITLLLYENRSWSVPWRLESWLSFVFVFVSLAVRPPVTVTVTVTVKVSNNSLPFSHVVPRLVLYLTRFRNSIAMASPQSKALIIDRVPFGVILTLGGTSVVNACSVENDVTIKFYTFRTIDPPASTADNCGGIDILLNRLALSGHFALKAFALEALLRCELYSKEIVHIKSILSMTIRPANLSRHVLHFILLCLLLTVVLISIQGPCVSTRSIIRGCAVRGGRYLPRTLNG